jgi:hypothetical protein
MILFFNDCKRGRGRAGGRGVGEERSCFASRNTLLAFVYVDFILEEFNAGGGGGGGRRREEVLVKEEDIGS